MVIVFSYAIIFCNAKLLIVSLSFEWPHLDDCIVMIVTLFIISLFHYFKILSFYLPYHLFYVQDIRLSFSIDTSSMDGLPSCSICSSSLQGFWLPRFAMVGFARHKLVWSIVYICYSTLIFYFRMGYHSPHRNCCCCVCHIIVIWWLSFWSNSDFSVHNDIPSVW